MSASHAASSMARRLAVETGILPLIGRFTGGVGAILMFHRIRRAPWAADPGATVDPDTFIEVIRTLRKYRYDIVSLDEALNRRGDHRGRFACLTFDDGYRDNHDVLWSIARAEQAPITIYLTTGYVDGSRPAWWLLLEAVIAARDSFTIDGKTVPAKTAAEKFRCYQTIAQRMPDGDAETARRRILEWLAEQDCDAGALQRETFMDWSMAKAMHKDPLVTFGAHTVSHARLSTLDAEGARQEIETCRDTMTGELGTPPRHFAFPFGQRNDSTPRDVSLVRAAGFASIVHATGGPVRRGMDPLNLPRIAFGGADGVNDLAVRLSGLRTFLQAV